MCAQKRDWPGTDRFGRQGHYDFSVAVADQQLLPAMRVAPPGTVVLADGYSCCTQLADLAGVEGQHLAQLFAARLPRPDNTNGRNVFERHGPCSRRLVVSRAVRPRAPTADRPPTHDIEMLIDSADVLSLVVIDSRCNDEWRFEIARRPRH